MRVDLENRYDDLHSLVCVVMNDLPWILQLDAPPGRTGTKNLPHHCTHTHRLYAEQEGMCVGCTPFPFRIMEVDHGLPRSVSVIDTPEELQAQC